MINSTVLGDVVDKCAAGSAELVVEGDRGGEGEEALEDALSEAGEGSGFPWRSSVRMSLQVQKMLSMRWRIGARCGTLLLLDLLVRHRRR